MRSINYILIVAFSLTGILQVNAQNDVSGQGKIINPDSVANPKVVSLLRKPEVFAAQQNVVPAGQPKIIPIPKDLTIITPGENGVPLPKSFPIGTTKRMIIQPKPVSSLPTKIKDDAVGNIQIIDVEQGAMSSYVNAVFEDSHGILWVGNLFGFSRFDGNNFTHYATPEVLSWREIYIFMEDSKGNIWFGTQHGGVIKYDGHTFLRYQDENGLGKREVRSIIEDSHGNIWFGTEDGIIRYDGDSLIHFTAVEGLIHNVVKSLLEDDKGNIWIGTIGGISLYDGKSFTQFSAKEGLSNSPITSIMEDEGGYLWFGTDGGGVYQFDGKSFIHYTTRQGLSNDHVITIAKGNNGNILFGTTENGVDLYDGSSFTNYSTEEGLSENEIWGILVDRQGNIWIGTRGGGLNLFVDRSFKHINSREGRGINAWAIMEDSNGDMWFGTRGGGVLHFDGVNFSRFTSEDGLSGNYVISILEDSQGIMWFGENRGLNRFDGKSFKIYTQTQGLINDGVSALAEGPKGNLWVGTEGGVNRFDGERFTQFTTAEGFRTHSIATIIEDDKGTMWFSTEGGGVNSFDGENFTHYSTKEGLSHNYVSPMLEDNKGNIWMGTGGGGINSFDGNSFKQYTTEEGLSNNIIWSVLEDKSGNLWLSTELGINLLKYPSDSDQGMEEVSGENIFQIYTFGREDGLIRTDFTPLGGYYDSQNRLWWGSSSGLTMLDLNKFSLPEEPPVNVQISHIDINQQFIDYRRLKIDSASVSSLEFGDDLNQSFDSVVAYQNYPVNMALPYDLDLLTFHFSAVDWVAPHKIQYSYLMEGLDEEWSPLQFENMVDYRNLPHGIYTFKLKAIGAAGIWGETFEYDFRILPPPWFTIWAYIFYSLLFIGGVFIVDRIQRKRLLEKERIGTQEKELEQAKEIEKAYTDLKATQSQLIQSEKMASLGELTAGIAHEIQNPLNFVNNFSEVSGELIDEMKEELLNDNKEDAIEVADDLKQNLEKINQHGSRASGIVKAMLEHSRANQGEKESTDINVLADKYLRLAYHGLRAKDKSFNADFKTEFEESLPKIEVVPQEIGRVLLNLINNAFYVVDKKAKEEQEGYQPMVEVITKKRSDSIEIRVKDNGPGIPEQVRDKIFQPFFTTKPTGSGTGLGLSLSYDIVKAHGGELKVESTESEGTEFIIQLPFKTNE